MSRNIPLFDFAFHPYPDWLGDIASNTKTEPWGRDKKVLETYLKANFEIARQQDKIVENDSEGYAIWRAGYLVTPSMDPIWLYYEKNTRPNTKWYFKGLRYGSDPLPGISAKTHTVSYEPPEFHADWNIYIDNKSFNHILTDHKDRLVTIFGDEVKNSHRLFRTLYGEIMLQQKEAAGVIPQWYMEGYNFLMPLCFSSPEKIDITAALTIDNTMKRYQLRTLLPPHYAYANARAVIKTRSQFASWAIIDETTLNAATYDDTEEGA